MLELPKKARRSCCGCGRPGTDQAPLTSCMHCPHWYCPACASPEGHMCPCALDRCALHDTSACECIGVHASPVSLITKNTFFETVVPCDGSRRRCSSAPPATHLREINIHWVSEESMVMQSQRSVIAWSPQACSDRHLPGWHVAPAVDPEHALLPCRSSMLVAVLCRTR